MDNIEKNMETANDKGNFFEAVHRRKDGSCFNVEVCSRAIILDKQRILGIVIRDITRRKIMEGKIKRQEELFRTVFEQSPIGMAFCTSNGDIIDANPMYEKILGRPINELKYTGWEHITHPEDIGKDAEKFERYKAGLEKVFKTHKRYLKPDGSTVCANLTLAPLTLESSPEHINIAMLEDITEKVRTELELQKNERFKTILLSNVPGMVYRCSYDREWTMQFISDGCYELTGYSVESLLHNKVVSYNELINPEYRKHLWNKWAELLPRKGILREEYSITTASGEIKWVYEQGRGIYDEKGNVVALEGLIIDITDRKKKEEEIRYLYHHDILTGLHNRTYFEEKIKALDEEKLLPVSIIVADINGLKFINDTLGCSYGDKLIVEFANILNACVSDQGIVARTGGDDFSIILPGKGSKAAGKMMKQIEAACDGYISESKHVWQQISISLGSATKVNVTEPLGDIFRNAEDRMYQNKLLQSTSIHNSVIASMKTTLLEKNRETEEHALRLIELSKAIGQKMMLTDAQLDELSLLSILHDIGKIGVSDSILNKPGRLTADERLLMCKHPEIGYRIAMTSRELQPIAEYILCHHERYDGKGYPQGLKGEDIPLLSRIIAVVDAYDAMISDRPYRKAMSREAAIQEIIQNAGTQFDPRVVEVFLGCLESM